jgi:hypothetical protein
MFGLILPYQTNPMNNSTRHRIFIFLFIFTSGYLHAQTSLFHSVEGIHAFNSPTAHRAKDGSVFYEIGFSEYLAEMLTTNCLPHTPFTYSDTLQLVSRTALQPQTPKFLSIHGNISYNFSYRSFVDTPYSQTDLQQHQVFTTLHFTLKEKYPLTMVISSKKSNSPFFRDATDVNVQYNKAPLLNNIKADIRKKIFNQLPNPNLSTLENKIAANRVQIDNLKNWLHSPLRAQELVQEKEKELHSLSHIPAKPVPNASQIPDAIIDKSRKSIEEKALLLEDSVKGLAAGLEDSSVTEKFLQKQKELDSMQNELETQSSSLVRKKRTVADSLNKLKSELNKVTTTAGLYNFMKSQGINRDSLSTTDKLLLSINKVSLGRSTVSYSELTVKNISLTGLNIEANPSHFYLAMALGKINNRFRDFIYKSNTPTANQSLVLMRAGLGQKDNNNLIFTFYKGEKLAYQPVSIPNQTAQKVLGFSVESRLQVNKNTYMIAEVAKSSFDDMNLSGGHPSLIKKALNLKLRSNEAVSVKLFNYYPQFHTKITGYYRKMGENFQSFNLYPSNITSEAWMIRMNQGLLKGRINVDAAIRKNDFESPANNVFHFNNKTVFKSIQASIKFPKYPFISVGYYPSSQLSIAQSNTLVETQYNTLNAVLDYSYHIANLSMNSNAFFTKYYNSGADSGFVYYNASSYSVRHNIYLKKLNFQSAILLMQQQALHLLTIEQGLSLQMNNFLSLRGALKWNRLNRAETLYGYNAALKLQFKRIGLFQLEYDKTFLPGFNRVLMPVDMGRLTFYREF